MPRARANGIELEYDTFGRPGDPTLLLVMGFGAQMILWRESFCEALAARGLHVVRFDNRDCGLSTQLDHLPSADLESVARRGARRQADRRRPTRCPTWRPTRSDSSTRSGSSSAHVAGGSMGGMIAQTIAIEHPERVRTLISIMSTTGAPTCRLPKPEAMAALVAPMANDRAGAVERGLAMSRALGSPGYPFDEADERALLERMLRTRRAARGHRAPAPRRSSQRPAGARSWRPCARRRSSSTASPTRSSRSRAGRETAAAVPGAELLEIEGHGPRPAARALADDRRRDREARRARLSGARLRASVSRTGARSGRCAAPLARGARRRAPVARVVRRAQEVGLGQRARSPRPAPRSSPPTPRSGAASRRRRRRCPPSRCDRRRRRRRPARALRRSRVHLRAVGLHPHRVVVEEDQQHRVEIAHVRREGIVEGPVEAHDPLHRGLREPLRPRLLGERARAGRSSSARRRGPSGPTTRASSSAV